MGAVGEDAVSSVVESRPLTKSPVVTSQRPGLRWAWPRSRVRRWELLRRLDALPACLEPLKWRRRSGEPAPAPKTPNPLTNEPMFDTTRQEGCAGCRFPRSGPRIDFFWPPLPPPTAARRTASLGREALPAMKPTGSGSRSKPAAKRESRFERGEVLRCACPRLHSPVAVQAGRPATPRLHQMPA